MAIRSMSGSGRLRPSAWFISVGVIILVTTLGWLFRIKLTQIAVFHPAVYTAAVIFMAFTLVALASVLWIEAEYLRRAWRSRVAATVGLEGLAPPPIWRSIITRLPDPLEIVLRPVWRTSFGESLHDDWIDAELGGKPSRYALLLILSAVVGYVLGLRIGGPILAVGLAFVVPLLPRSLVSGRAEARRRRFGEQLPQALDAVASGLSAGLSFQQAVEYARDDLQDPAKSAFATLSGRIALGFSVEQALSRLLELYPDESLALVVDGLVLQRQFGGDMVRMLEDVAGVLRERLELEREVRAVTTQGRLSGIIIAALVPVSAGFLLSFNPRYVDVLFDTILGQVLVIVAISLQLIGWAIISRLVQIRY
jgi:tight adherence protein B